MEYQIRIFIDYYSYQKSTHIHKLFRNFDHLLFNIFRTTIVRYVHMLFSCIEQKALTRLLANSQIISDRQLVRLHNVLLM